MKTIADRLENTPPLFFADLAEKIHILRQAGKEVIRLDIGSPDLPPAPHIIHALTQSAQEPDRHGYQMHRGTPGLRNAWADMYRRVYQVELDPEGEVLPLQGSKEGIFHLALALIDPGDVVLIPDPGYITYTQGTLMAGGRPYYLPLLPERDYLPDLDAIPAEILRQARLLWLNYPNNPTAATAPSAFFKDVVAFAQEHDILVCHDAAYSQVTFDGYRPLSILQVPAAKEVAIEFNSLSKSHNMAGWRLGAVVGNSRVLASLHTLKTNVDSGHFLPIMEAAIAAMCGDQTWLVERNRVYQQRRDLVIQALHRLGLRAATPKASLYVWFAVPRGWSSLDFTRYILEQAWVSLTPGSIFGKHGEGYVRLAFTVPTQQVVEAMERITRILK